MTTVVKRFISLYEQLDKNSIEQLSDVYHPDIVFQDPAHEITGWHDFYRYFEGLMENLSFCHFNIQSHHQENDEAFLVWEMTFEHPKISNGEPVVVSGSSHLKMFDERVIYHRDYFDMGQMLYEHLPVLSQAIRWIKRRMRSE
ncbi:nuclear transport factor 2 family protein [Algicola sagamiensis]|uniref:nuclear transport factor 2 family protein n=1 Tax=Algicola sagamiensis TaxID=163869 RepID=UPI000362C496|nr:nuclear transport factor 2 family protein [Algicola sagamiensis]